MPSKIWALYVKTRLLWVLTAALALGAAAPAASAAPNHGPQGREASIWGNYHPKGWSAGSVARGTGYWRPGASLRVREVQRRLNRSNYGAGQVDGFFGPITDAGVRHYQGDHALQVDGIVGPKTLKDLRSRTGQVQGTTRRQTSASKPQTHHRKAAQTAFRQETAMAPAAHAKSIHGARRPAVGDQTSGYEKVWWILLMFVIAGLAILLLVAPAPAMDAIKRPGRFIRRHARLGPSGARPEGDLMRLVFVEGRSADEQIGDFRGFAYATWPVGGGEEDEGARLLLVYDRSQPKPFSARLSEITRINGQTRRQQASEPGAPQPVTGTDAPARLGHVARSAPSPVVASRIETSSDSPGNGARLRIVRRVEAPPGADTLGGKRSPAGTAWRTSGGARRSSRFRWLGARVHLADAQGMDAVPGTLLVDVELFAESEYRRWETGLLRIGGPSRVSIDDLESSVRALVVPDWLPALAEALTGAGVVFTPEELARLPFAVERSIDVERAVGGVGVPDASRLASEVPAAVFDEVFRTEGR